jgi:polyhydroxyalkanoate synthesis regulator phasin
MLEAESKQSFVDQILRQTNYSQEEALEKLQERNNDVEQVILDYYSIKPKKESFVSYNQEIYRQIRKKLGHVTNKIAVEDK